MCNARRSYFVGHIELKNKNKFNLEDKITIKKFAIYEESSKMI